MSRKGAKGDTGRHDPLRGHKFKVLSSGNFLTGSCGFQKVSGLSDESEVSEYRDGCDPVTNRKFPGLVTFENITLERGLDLEKGIISWRQAVVRSGSSESISTTANGAFDASAEGQKDSFRSTLLIELYDRGSKDKVRSWSATDAWPCKLDDGELDASSSDVVISTAEFCHEGLSREIKTYDGQPV